MRGKRKDVQDYTSSSSSHQIQIVIVWSFKVVEIVARVKRQNRMDIVLSDYQHKSPDNRCNLKSTSLIFPRADMNAI